MKYDLLIFDVDGTLVTDYNSDQLLPEATGFFSKLPKRGPALALATNQGGVGLRYWMEQNQFGNPEELPTQIQARSRILRIAGQIADLYQYPQVYIAWAYQSKSSGIWGPISDDKDPEWSQEFRKPNPGMIIAAMNHNQVSPSRTLMIGDRDEDWQAGRAGGCDVAVTNEFWSENYE